MALFVFAGRALAAIELASFILQTELDRIRLDWETATELNNAGFFVLRNEAGGSDPFLYTPIPVIDATSGTPYTFIPARGDDLTGAEYVFLDEDVTIGTRYYYLLQDVDTSNNSSYHTPVPPYVVAGQTSTPTSPATLISSLTPTKTVTPAKTNTPTPSRTPTPLAAPRTSTPSGSATPSSTAVAPTDTVEPTQTISVVDVTLTAISLILTGQPTPTETETPIALAQASPRAASATPSITPAVDLPEVRVPIPAGRIATIAVAVLVFGALLTAGIVITMRKNL